MKCNNILRFELPNVILLSWISIFFQVTRRVVADGVEREEEVNLTKLGVAILIWNNF